MPQYSTVFEIDTHVRMTTICALDAESGEYACRMFKGNGYTEMREWMGGFPKPTLGASETMEGKVFCAFVSLIATMRKQKELGPLMKRRNQPDSTRTG